MGVLESLLEELQAVRMENREILERISEIEHRVDPKQEWFTKDQCAALKNINKGTADNHSWLWPNSGAGVKVGKRLMFHRDWVIPWLDETDEELEGAHRVREKAHWYPSEEETP